MKPLSFFAVLLLAFFMRGLANCQAPGEKLLTAEDFEKFRIIDEGHDLDEETFWLQISKDLPPYKIRLVPIGSKEESLGADNPEHRVARIEISTGSPLRIVQTIDVDTRTAAIGFRDFFRVTDINFDGYLDIAVVDEFGAKWVRQKFWLFDKDSRRFITNSLTADLYRLTDNKIDLHPETREITVSNLRVPPAIQSRTYKVGEEHLELVGIEAIEPTDTGIRIYKKRKIDGKFTIVGIQDLAF